MPGTRVTCTDIDTGDTQTVVLVDDYVVITDGCMKVETVQQWGNGTVQFTVKRLGGRTPTRHPVTASKGASDGQ